MTITPPLLLSCSAVFFSLLFLSLPRHLHGLGSGGTLAVTYATATVCGIVAGEPNHRIECFQNQNRVVNIQPNVSYDAISGGRSFFCGLRSGGRYLLCWDTNTFQPKRVYFSNSAPLSEISVGDDQICGVVNATNEVICWRGTNGFDRNPRGDYGFRSISSGVGFSCGILVNNNTVRCWGSNSTMANQIESQFQNISMNSIVAGGGHVCGFNSTGFLVCKGSNSSGQLDFPSNLPFEFSELTLGLDYSCGIRQPNGSVVCWGGGGRYSSNVTQGVGFETLAGGLNFSCGILTRNFSTICWGPGWSNQGFNLPFSKFLPGFCVQSECSQCGIFPDSQSLCSGPGNICKPFSLSCATTPSSPPPSIPPSPPSTPPSKRLRLWLLVFGIVGSVGALAGISTIIYCIYTGATRKKVHNSVQPTITRGSSTTSRGSSNPPSRSLTIRRQGSRAFWRQRSGTSSAKHADRAEEFTFKELASATNDFALENKIGAGSFGVIYRGKLSDGREVAIKRGETNPRTKKPQDKETAFESEIAFLSRLHHKHLVRLVGYCEERDERLLVYEYMKNGALYDHLHNRNTNVEKHSSFINSWKVRIRIALDAARGIEYLHNYAVPPIIHRDIKSSNILLDATWTARVSDFGLSMMGPDPDVGLRPTNAAGTLGYIDPEYYSLNVLTAKSDVYGFGVVLLELLTGKKAIIKGDDEGDDPMSVVDYAVPAIAAGEVGRILDTRVGPPVSGEADAVELVAYTALLCVNLEGKDRPTMTDIVGSLERALSLCEDSHGSISSAGISIASD